MTGSRSVSLSVLAVAAVACGASDSTPEGAVRALEAAYIRKDIEAAVALRDFRTEASLTWASLRPELVNDEEILRATAEVLELSFRREIETNGFPDFASLKCRFSKKEQMSPDLVKLTEECIFPDGGKSVEEIHVSRGEAGWRVVIVPS